MLLAVLSANTGACATADACSRIGDRHDLAQNLLIVVQAHEISIFCEAHQCHHVAAADFEAASTADTSLWINGQ